ncbi:MAG: isochorismate synthase [Chloroflexi bacterium]|nr:MAG: isochorismate synthase [Chloroflexota bacterium]
MMKMDTFSTNIPKTSIAHTAWSIYCHRQQLLATLRQASKKARQQQTTTLVSFTQPVATCDPLRLFRAFEHAAMGERLFWEYPAEQRALVGVGTATTIQAMGADSFVSIATAWRTLQQEVVKGPADAIQTPGPILLGGFAFDPLRPRTSLWANFPDGLLILPHLLFHIQHEHAMLIISQEITPTDDIEQCADAILDRLQHISTLVANTPLPEREQTTSKLLLRDISPASAWKDLVAMVVKQIKSDAYQKVVLARSVEAINVDHAFDANTTLQYLRVIYPNAHVFALQRGMHYFVGATPERLLSAHHGQLRTMALAGSAPRGKTQEEDDHLGAELLLSAKNKNEHEIVVATIHDALARFCSRVWIADAPELLRLKNIQHLETPIVGELLAGYSILDAIQSLHPTPAVGGFPCDKALQEIRENEQLDRGWYAGPFGWVDAHGDGEFAVALRSALIDGKTATLFAGCGIVADSDPESEYLESCLKLNVMLRGLGGEESEQER